MKIAHTFIRTVSLVASVWAVGCASGADPANTGGMTSLTDSGGNGSTSGTDTGSGGSGGTDGTDGTTSSTSGGPGTSGTSSTSSTGSSETGLATCDLDISFNFEGCAANFTVDKTDPAAAAPTWECGNPTSFSLGPGTGKTGVWGTNLSGLYNDGESSTLTSPPFSLAECDGASVTLSLAHWYNFEGGANNADGGILEVSKDGGQSWELLGSDMNGYFQGQALSASYPPVDGANGFSALDANSMWRTSTFDLSAYGGEADMAIRLVFGSDSANPRGGWYVDLISLSSP